VSIPHDSDGARARAFGRRGLLARLLALGSLPWLAVRAAGAAHQRPTRAFAAEEVATALRELFGRDDIPLSPKVRIGVARLAENGAVVPVKVDVDLPHVDEITLLATRNPVPLVGRFTFGPRTRPFVAARIKLAETSEVLAIARRGDELLMARAAVEVTVGGCG
jgi:sulfur-oxidizing protein SoxY